MKYLSTRGGQASSFKEVLILGLANDGGLFIPETWPKINISQLDSNINYIDLTYEIISPFIGDDIPAEILKNIIIKAYKNNFKEKNLVTFKKLSTNEIIVELFNGPTLAFKDFAMQLLIPIFDYFLDIEKKKLNLIVATSGDTGSAAINAVSKSKNLNIFCLFPKDRVSEFQRRQMSTVIDEKITLCEIDGTFDDCQNIVKNILGDTEFSKRYLISAVNSINWARVMIQVVYYFYAAIKLDGGNSQYNFSVPTGNFGDVYAGYIAKKMGLNINTLIVATNENDILDRFLKTGVYSTNQVIKTSSPSMDIQVASNFERLLFDLLDRSNDLTTEKMMNLKDYGKITLNKEQLAKAKELFKSAKANMDNVKDTIANIYENDQYLTDPHTAVGVYALRMTVKNNNNNFILGTAHPVKFIETVESAVNKKLNLQDQYSHLFNANENFLSLSNDSQVVMNEIIKRN